MIKQSVMLTVLYTANLSITLTKVHLRFCRVPAVNSINCNVSGFVGKGLPIFGIKIFINSHEYSIYYRVINENQEISSWFKDGEECLSKCRIFNLQISAICSIFVHSFLFLPNHKF